MRLSQNSRQESLANVNRIEQIFTKNFMPLYPRMYAAADAHAMVQNTMSSLHDMARDMQLGTASFRNRLLGRFMGIS